MKLLGVNYRLRVSGGLVGGGMEMGRLKGGGGSKGESENGKDEGDFRRKGYP